MKTSPSHSVKNNSVFSWTFWVFSLHALLSLFVFELFSCIFKPHFKRFWSSLENYLLDIVLHSVSSKMCSVSMSWRSDQEVGKTNLHGNPSVFQCRVSGSVRIAIVVSCHRNHCSGFVVHFLSTLLISILNPSWPLQFCNLYTYINDIMPNGQFLRIQNNRKELQKSLHRLWYTKKDPKVHWDTEQGADLGQGNRCNKEKAF